MHVKYGMKQFITRRLKSLFKEETTPAKREPTASSESSARKPHEPQIIIEPVQETDDPRASVQFEAADARPNLHLHFLKSLQSGSRDDDFQRRKSRCRLSFVKGASPYDQRMPSHHRFLPEPTFLKKEREKFQQNIAKMEDILSEIKYRAVQEKE